MADSVRIQRIAEQIRAELSQALREEVRDPRLSLLTVTRVKLAPDLALATVFYSPLGEDPDAERRAALDDAMRGVSGFLRRTLSKRMKLRHTPELRFVLDDSIAEGSQTLALIRDLELPEDAEAADGEGDAVGGEGGRDGTA